MSKCVIFTRIAASPTMAFPSQRFSCFELQCVSSFNPVIRNMQYVHHLKNSLEQCPSVLLFKPKYRLCHPDNYLFSLSKKIFYLSKYPKNISFNFENRSNGALAVLSFYARTVLPFYALAMLPFYARAMLPYYLCFCYEAMYHFTRHLNILSG